MDEVYEIIEEFLRKVEMLALAKLAELDGPTQVLLGRGVGLLEQVSEAINPDMEDDES